MADTTDKTVCGNQKGKTEIETPAEITLCPSLGTTGCTVTEDHNSGFP